MWNGGRWSKLFIFLANFLSFFLSFFHSFLLSFILSFFLFIGGVDSITFTEANSTVCDAVMLLQDDNVEGPETQSLNLFSPTPAIPGFTPTTAIASVTIQDINRKYQE